MHQKMIYLATPYSHPDPAVMHERFIVVNRKAAELMAQGHIVFSPISHSHPIAEAGELPTTWDYWRDYDTKMLQVCSDLYVLKQEGWDNSKGVAGEISIAKDLNMPITFIEE